MSRILYVLALVGCGDDGSIDLSGTYAVESLTGDLMSCTGNDPNNDQIAPYYKITLTRVDAGFESVACADFGNGNPPSCSEAELYDESVDDGWRGIEHKTFADPRGGCQLSRIVHDATLSSNKIVLVRTSYLDTFQSEPCTVERARELGDMLPCHGTQRWVATRLTR